MLGQIGVSTALLLAAWSKAKGERGSKPAAIDQFWAGLVKIMPVFCSMICGHRSDSEPIPAAGR